jgi:hypothetical protein
MRRGRQTCCRCRNAARGGNALCGRGALQCNAASAAVRVVGGSCPGPYLRVRADPPDAASAQGHAHCPCLPPPALIGTRRALVDTSGGRRAQGRAFLPSAPWRFPLHRPALARLPTPDCSSHRLSLGPDVPATQSEQRERSNSCSWHCASLLTSHRPRVCMRAPARTASSERNARRVLATKSTRKSNHSCTAACSYIVYCLC